MSYTIQLDPQVPVTADQSCYVVTIAEATILRVTVTTDDARIQEWLNLTLLSNGDNIVSIHAEPRPFCCELVPACAQPNIAALFIAIGLHVLVVQVRSSQALPQILANQLLANRRLFFVGMNQAHTSQWLRARGHNLNNCMDVRALVAGNTGRERLRTVGLRRLVRVVLRHTLNPSLSSRFCLLRWWFPNLSPELVMQGSIRAFLVFRMARATLYGSRSIRRLRRRRHR
ncbi:hypothetical protein J5N97_007285 [Dioscorea zingiberensis]|uniref:Uncharacterized protein n=1 Tax=Dioscorea zingiberensis TaxID=325984 RepID=A0A9D5DCW6_9LILI|nr:hypothetical protein J5N97_007285 [Dioscorea zingiberensis]